jgi:hypothetical protein
MRHDAEVVAHQQVGQAALLAQIGQEVEDLRLDGDVERRGRLIQEENLRLEHQRAGDRDPLALTTRELVRIAKAERGRQADRFDRRQDSLLGSVEPVDARRLDQLRMHGLARMQRAVGILEDHLHALEEPPAVALADHLAGDADGAIVASIEAGEDAQYRRLAAARFTDEAEGLAGG